MKAIIHRQPNILCETIEMLYMHYNGVSFEDDKEHLQKKYGLIFKRDEMDAIIKRIDCINDICGEIMKDADKNDPRLSYYFKSLDGKSGSWWDYCPAAMLALTFIDPGINGFDEAIEYAKSSRRRLFNTRFKLQGILPSGLVFTTTEISEQSFIKQLSELECSSVYKWTACELFEDFDSHMNELADLIRPFAEKLECGLEANRATWKEIYDYWEDYFQNHSISEFRRDLTNTGGAADDNFEELHVNLNIVAARYLRSDFELFANARAAHVFIGTSLNSSSRIMPTTSDIQSVGRAFRTLSEKGKLELLRTLAFKRSHCTEIAAETGINSGTVSKMLDALYHLGLLNFERVDNKFYYTTNLENYYRLLDSARELVSRPLE